MRRAACVLLLVLPALSGCIGTTSSPTAAASGLDEVQEAVDDLIGTLKADHDHQDPALHDERHNLEAIAYDELIGEEGQPGAYTDIDLWGDYVVMETKRPVGGFVIADVSDPADPEVVSHYEAGNMYAPDVKWGPEGNHVFIGVHFPGYDEGNAPTILDHESPIPLGISAIDVSDKEDPRFTSYMQCGSSGVHNVNVEEIDGTTWVFGACYDSFLNRVVIGRFDEASGQLVRVGEFSLGSFVEGNRGSVHDMVVKPDPIDGTPVMTVSYGNEGVVWVDVSDPMEPEVLGQWTWEGSQHVTGEHPRFMHYAEVYGEEVFDRRITIAAPEYAAHSHSGQVWIVDTTHYDSPRLLGTWQVSEDLVFQIDDEDPASVYRYSPHNIKMHDGKFYIAHNHAGIWAVDFASTEKRLEDPKTAGFYAASMDPGHEIPIDNAPDFWGLDIDDAGHVYAADRGTGLYVLGLGDHAGHGHDMS